MIPTNARSWDSGDYPRAVKSAWNALRDLTRRRLNVPGLDGSQLMTHIGDAGANGNPPNLPLTGMADDTETDVHRGVWRLFVGTAFYIRNPEMHETESPVEGDRVGAFERQVASARCGRWVATDKTLTVGIEMLTPSLLEQLPARSAPTRPTRPTSSATCSAGDRSSSRACARRLAMTPQAYW